MMKVRGTAVALLLAMIASMNNGSDAFFVALSSVSTKGSSLPRKPRTARTVFSMNSPSMNEDSPPPSINSSSASSSTTTTSGYLEWAQSNGIELNNKVTIRDTTEEERGKGGVVARQNIEALEVLAKIPRSLVISALDAPTRAIEAASRAKAFGWATELTAATLASWQPMEEELLVVDNNGATTVDTWKAKKDFVNLWTDGGWATKGSDLGPPEANFGPQFVTGSLMATGSDNDHNIYAKFRMACHPVLLRASKGLTLLTGCTEEEARTLLTTRGRWYRSMRDALQNLVLEFTDREKGSYREKKCWDVADTLSKVLSRVTMVNFDGKGGEGNAPVTAIVPIHERLAHGANGGNTRLIGVVVSDKGKAGAEEQLWLVATKNIAAGTDVTRDYSIEPALEFLKNEQFDEEDNEIAIDANSALRLLVQFGLPPSAW